MTNLPLLDAIFFSKTGLQMRFDKDGGSNIIYVGAAVPGKAEDAPSWQIQKLTYDGSNDVTDIDFAESSNEFRYKWSLRATYAY